MAFIKQFDRTKLPKTRVELHLHLDGSIRIETIWELAKSKNINLGVDSVQALRSKLNLTTPGNLKTFLELFPYFSQTFTDDPDALKRITYELCQDQAAEGVAYFEARYSPHLVLTPGSRYTPEQIVDAVNAGLQQGEKDFGVRARQVLCCVKSDDKIATETLKLCEKYKDNGVVAIDIAKDETQGVVGYTQMEKQVYQRAYQLGIHRTAHAGESGPWNTVRDCMESLQCERVGHGYRTFDDPSGETYNLARKRNLHFEICPYSSILTGGNPLTKKHAVVRLAEDNANFSISKDDTTITGTTLDDEYAFVTQLGLTEVHILRANINAARSCFLPEADKQELEKSILREIVTKKN